MAVQGSGQVSLKDVADEFGDTAPHSMSEFFGEGSAPASGETQLSDFYGASSSIDFSGFTAGSVQSFNGSGNDGRGSYARARGGYAIIGMSTYYDQLGSNTCGWEIYHNSSGTSWSKQADLGGTTLPTNSRNQQCCISPNYCAVGTNNQDQVRIWQRSGTSWNFQQGFGLDCWDLDMDAEGDVLAIASNTAASIYLRTGSGSSTYTVTQSISAPSSGRHTSVKVSSDGQYILFGNPYGFSGMTPQLFLYQRSGNTWSVISNINTPAQYTAQRGCMSMSDDATVLVASQNSNSVGYIWRGTPGGSYTRYDVGSGFSACGVSYDGNVVAFGHYTDNKTYVYTWNGSGYSNTSTTSAFAESGSGTMAVCFDTGTKYMIVGLGGDYFNETGGSANFVAD